MFVTISERDVRTNVARNDVTIGVEWTLGASASRVDNERYEMTASEVIVELSEASCEYKNVRACYAKTRQPMVCSEDGCQYKCPSSFVMEQRALPKMCKVQ